MPCASWRADGRTSAGGGGDRGRECVRLRTGRLGPRASASRGWASAAMTDAPYGASPSGRRPGLEPQQRHEREHDRGDHEQCRQHQQGAGGHRHDPRERVRARRPRRPCRAARASARPAPTSAGARPSAVTSAVLRLDQPALVLDAARAVAQVHVQAGRAGVVERAVEAVGHERLRAQAPAAALERARRSAAAPCAPRRARAPSSASRNAQLGRRGRGRSRPATTTSASARACSLGQARAAAPRRGSTARSGSTGPAGMSGHRAQRRELHVGEHTPPSSLNSKYLKACPNTRKWRKPVAGYAKDVLVDTQWVEDHLSDDSIRIVEVDENPALYAEAHIPGAIGFDWKKDLQDQVKRDFLGPEEFGELFGSRGISNDHTVVLYGDRNNWFAAYTYWYLKYYGHDNVKLMNGPREKWISEGRPTSDRRARATTPQTFSAQRGRRRDPRLPRRGAGRARHGHEARGRALAAGVLGRADRDGGLRAGGRAARRPHPRRGVGAVGPGGAGGRHLQVGRRAARALHGRRA